MTLRKVSTAAQRLWTVEDQANIHVLFGNVLHRAGRRMACVQTPRLARYALHDPLPLFPLTKVITDFLPRLNLSR